MTAAALRQPVPPDAVDFLIVVANKDEYGAVVDLLGETHTVAQYTVASAPHPRNREPYSVAVTIIDPSNSPAQAGTFAAITRLRPRVVILAGIAAGFAEAGVAPGDVLVPHWIVPYEQTKEWEFDVEHRGDAVDVSYRPWKHAQALANNPALWLPRLTEPRPDGTTDSPKVRVEWPDKLGSGEKVIAAETSHVRRWLLEEFSARALGLEMEAYGVLSACRVEEVPCLVIKSAQDDATGAKSDLWRRYAAGAAAAFAVTLIEGYEFKDELERSILRGGVRCLQQWQAPEVTQVISHAMDCIEIVDSHYDEATYLVAQVGEALANGATSLRVVVHMLDPREAFGAQRLLEKADHETRANRKWSATSRDFEAKFRQDCESLREGFLQNAQTRRAGVRLELYSYPTMPGMRIVVVDNTHFFVGWFPLSDTNPNHPCLHVQATSPLRAEQELVTRIRGQLEQIHLERKPVVRP